MTRKYFILITFLFLLIDGNLFAQEVEIPGIHQTEHEYYKSKVVSLEKSDQGEPIISLQNRQNAPTREIFGYHPYWMNSAYPFYNYNLLTTLAYFGLDINSQGNITDNHSWPVTGLINLAHSYGVKVVLVAINFDTNSLTTLLSSAANRTRLVNNLLEEVKKGNADGINIDFESFPASQKQNLNIFMQALADTFHKHIPNSTVSIALPAVNWSNKFDYFSLASICDALFIMGYNYYWSGSSNAGPVAPITGWGTYNVTWTVNDYLSRTQGQREKIILGLPYYGFKWPVTSNYIGATTTGDGSSMQYHAAEAEALSKGKLWDSESQTPWYRYSSGSWYQCWYDDSLSLSLKYQLAIEEDLQGVGMWALGYDGSRTELWGALRDVFGSTTPPNPVGDFQVCNIGGGLIRVKASFSPDATGYNTYIATDREHFHLKYSTSQPNIVCSGLSDDSTYFFKMTAFNEYGESVESEVLAAAKANKLAEVLIVNGFDRKSVAGNTRDFSIEHGISIKNSGYAFDAASNEAVINGGVDLTDYKIVDWILGQESTVDETFSDLEQDIVKAYLEQGGNLFVSGSEIAWDLDYKGSSSDKEFYHSYLKASYVADKVDDYNISGTEGGIFNNVVFTFDDGNNGIYDVAYPDGITPVNGSEMSLMYNDQYCAGIQFSGTIGQAEARLVNLGIPFETIYPDSSRNIVMSRVLNFLSGTTGISNQSATTTTTVTSPLLFQNYPNPFNQSTSIKFNIPTQEKISLHIFNVLGEEVKTLLQEYDAVPGNHEVIWDGKDNDGNTLSSGVYVYRLTAGETVKTKRLILLK